MQKLILLFPLLLFIPIANSTVQEPQDRIKNCSDKPIKHVVALMGCLTDVNNYIENQFKNKFESQGFSLGADNTGVASNKEKQCDNIKKVKSKLDKFMSNFISSLSNTELKVMGSYSSEVTESKGRLELTQKRIVEEEHKYCGTPIIEPNLNKNDTEQPTTAEQ